MLDNRDELAPSHVPRASGMNFATLFACCESADASFGQPEHSEPPLCVTQCHKALPVKLGDLALCVTLANFK